MADTPIGAVILNGTTLSAADAAIPVHDVGLLRGYGCFEVVRAYDGVAFRLGEHLGRLENSARLLGIPLPPRGDLEAWAADRATEGDVAVRIVVTGGTDLDALGSASSTIVYAFASPLPTEPMRLFEMPAPWHPAGEPWELTGVKSLSYAPNAAALLRARAEGFDDALLLSVGTTVLELPMASVGWVIDGALETPSLDLGILRSVTRSATLQIAADLGLAVAEGQYPSTRLHAADEAFVMSTTKEIVPAVAVGSREFDPGPVTAELARGYRRLVLAETGR